MKVTTCSQRPILEPCGLKDMDYQVDPYVGCGHYCYYCYALEHAETDWAREVRIHGDIVGQLGEELEAIPPQTIYMGYNTDPYQPVEADQRQTQNVLELFAKKGFSASFLTKSDLFLRDMKLLRRMKDARVSISTAFLDEDVRECFEHDTTPTQMRLDALGQMHAAGLRTSALICPIIPHVTDTLELVDRLAPITETIWIYGLNIQDREGRNWKNLQPIFAEHFPDKQEQIEDIVFDREHSYWRELREELERVQGQVEPELNIHI